VLCGKTLQISLLEVLEEEELKFMKQEQENLRQVQALKDRLFAAERDFQTLE